MSSANDATFENFDRLAQSFVDDIKRQGLPSEVVLSLLQKIKQDYDTYYPKRQTSSTRDAAARDIAKLQTESARKPSAQRKAGLEQFGEIIDDAISVWTAQVEQLFPPKDIANPPEKSRPKSRTPGAGDADADEYEIVNDRPVIRSGIEAAERLRKRAPVVALPPGAKSLDEIRRQTSAVELGEAPDFDDPDAGLNVFQRAEKTAEKARRVVLKNIESTQRLDPTGKVRRPPQGVKLKDPSKGLGKAPVPGVKRLIKRKGLFSALEAKDLTCPPGKTRDPNLRLKPHQIEVIELLFRPTVHGVIAVHGLGTGKTLTAVAAAECFLNRNPDGFVLVVSPTQLIETFVVEKLCKFDAPNAEKNLSHYMFASYAALNSLQVLFQCYNHKDLPFMLIIDEAHNLKTPVTEDRTAFSATTNEARRNQQTLVDFVLKILRRPNLRQSLVERFWAITQPEDQRALLEVQNDDAALAAKLVELSEKPMYALAKRKSGEGSSVPILPSDYEGQSKDTRDVRRKQAQQFLDTALLSTGIQSQNLFLCSRFAWKVLLLTGTPIIDNPVDIKVLVRLANPDAELPDDFNELLTNDVKLKLFIRNKYSDPIFHFYEPSPEERAKSFPTMLPYETVEIFVDEDPAYKAAFERVESVILSAESDGGVIEPVPGSPHLGRTFTNSFLIKFRELQNTVKAKGSDVAPKIKKIYEMLREAKKANEKALVFFFFQKHGVGELIQYLDAQNARAIAENRLDDVIKYGSASGTPEFTKLYDEGSQQQGRNREDVSRDIINRYNGGLLGVKPEDRLDAMIISSAFSEGLDLKGTRRLILGELGWNPGTEKQIIGRANRFLSHIGLPEKDRTVKVYRPLLVKSPKYKAQIESAIRRDSSLKIVPQTADERMLEILLAKGRDNDAFLARMKAQTDPVILSGLQRTCYDLPQESSAPLQPIETSQSENANRVDYFRDNNVYVTPESMSNEQRLGRLSALSTPSPIAPYKNPITATDLAQRPSSSAPKITQIGEARRSTPRPFFELELVAEGVAPTRTVRTLSAKSARPLAVLSKISPETAVIESRIQRKLGGKAIPRTIEGLLPLVSDTNPNKLTIPEINYLLSELATKLRPIIPDVTVENAAESAAKYVRQQERRTKNLAKLEERIRSGFGVRTIPKTVEDLEELLRQKAAAGVTEEEKQSVLDTIQVWRQYTEMKES